MFFRSKDDFYQAASANKPNFNLLGVDLGDKKIGLAYYNSAARLAVPLKVINAKDLNVLYKIIQEMNIHALVIGLAGHSDGTVDEKRIKKVEAFATSINNIKSLPMILVDESYTSQIANSMLQDIGMNRKRRHELDDAVAAQLVLESFFK